VSEAGQFRPLTSSTSPHPMNNPYAPPAAPVGTAPRSPVGAWLRVLVVVVACSVVALALSWLVAPALASWIAGLTHAAGMRLGPIHLDANPELLVLDLALSSIAFFAACALAAKLSNGHRVVAALGVAGVGWLVYFVEVRGVPGILSSEYPIWYELFPCHLGSGLLAAHLCRRRGGTTCSRRP